MQRIRIQQKFAITLQHYLTTRRYNIIFPNNITQRIQDRTSSVFSHSLRPVRESNKKYSEMRRTKPVDFRRNRVDLSPNPFYTTSTLSNLLLGLPLKDPTNARHDDTLGQSTHQSTQLLVNQSINLHGFAVSPIFFFLSLSLLSGS